ncbi:MAG: N-acetyltransferase family protein [Ilumatobacteraceae bacterium]
MRKLSDGGRILIRPLVPSDRDELAVRYEALSPATRRSRFGSAPDQLSASRLDELLDLDYHDRFALAALAVDEPFEPGVGVARYARSRDNPTDAEAAVIVVDAYQHRGIGSILLLDLVEVARAHGITRFLGTVMWENAELLDALLSWGAIVEPTEPGIASVRIELAETDRLEQHAVWKHDVT